MSIRTPRRRTENRRPLNVAASGALVIGLLLLVAALVVRTPSRGVPGLGYRTVFASVPDPGNLGPLNDVRIAGVRVGQVVNVRSKDQRALIRLRLDPGAERLPTDTAVLVRGAGLLGQRYVELRPGSSRETVPEGGTIRGDDRSLTYGIPDVLDTFDAATRRSLGDMVDGLGAGTLGRGHELNDALAAAPPAGNDFKTVVAAALSRPGAARRLVPSLESMGVALDASKEDIARGLRPGADALQPLADRRQALAATFDEAPGTLDTATRGLDGGRRLLASLRSLSSAVNHTLPGAPAALRETTAMLRQAPGPLAKASSLLDSVKPAVPAALGITSRLDPLLTPVRRALDDTLPLVDILGKHGCDIDNFGEDWRSLLGFGIRGDGQSAPLPNGFIGPLTSLRITAIASASSVQGTVKQGIKDVKEPYSPPCRFSPTTPYVDTRRP